MNYRRFIIVLFLAMVPACADHGNSPVGLENRLLWQSLDVHDYVIEQQRNCFCPNGGQTVQIVVRADTIASISALDSLMPAVIT